MNTIVPLSGYIAGCGLGVWVLTYYPAGVRPGWALSLLALGGVLLTVALFTRKDARLLTVALASSAAIAGCGVSLLHHSPPGPGDLATYNRVGEVKGKSDLVLGTVVGEPVLSDRAQRIRIASESFKRDGSAASITVRGDLLALISRYPELQEGERLQLGGALLPPETGNGTGYAEYLARAGVYSYMLFPKVRRLSPAPSLGLDRAVAEARRAVRANLNAALPDPQAALAVGVVVGDRSALPPDLLTAFRRSGAMHVLAISGENIAILIGFVWLLYSRKTSGGRMPVWLTAVILVLLSSYTLFTGATPSVVRAAIMGAALLAAPLVRRRYDPVAALTASAFLMTLYDPMLAGDAGFQLSFGAMLGIALVAPRIDGALAKIHVPAAIRFPLATSVGAQAVTAPIAASLSGELALLSALSTLTVDIALLPMMITGIALGLTGSLPLVSGILGAAVWACGEWMTVWVRFWASLPFAAVTIGKVDGLWLLPYFALLVALLVWLQNRSHVPRITGGNVNRGVLLGGMVGLVMWMLLLVAMFAR